MAFGTPTPVTRKDWWWILDPRCSLRARAALWLGGGTLLLAILLSWSTGLIYRRALETQLSTALETLAFQVSDKLDRSIYERYRTLQLTANLVAIRDSAAPIADRRNALDAVLETSPEIAWVGLTDAGGRIVLGTGRLFEGTSVETRPWFRTGRETPYIGPLREIAELARQAVPSPDGDRSSRFLDVAVPVTAANGQFGGVLAAHVRWNWSQEIQLSVVPESASRERVGVTVYGAGRDVLLDSGGSGWSQPPDAPPVGEGRKFRGSIIEDTAGGTRYLSGYARSRGYREYRGIGWLTVVRQPVDRAFASVVSLRRSIMIWGGVLAIAAGTTGWVAAGRHARRLRSVRAAADRIREGDILSVLPQPAGNEEISEMCKSVSELVEDLRAKQEALAAENARLAAKDRSASFRS